MNTSALHCISPIDGRYHKITSLLSPYFSEYGLIRYRVFVEAEYFKMLVNEGLSGLEDFPREGIGMLDSLVENYSEKDALEIKEYEAVTNHDIKAIEYFLKDRFESFGLGAYKEFVHFGLTSQDINNTAIPLSLNDALQHVLYPALEGLLDVLKDLAQQWRSIPMLAYTHGQAASPTTVGKELLVFVQRLNVQAKQLKSLPIPAKFGGATGNFNAHLISYPNTDWNLFAENFLTSLGLSRSYPTTQIDHYDNLAAIFDNLKRICTIIVDMDRDFWTYISMRYFTQKIRPTEVGSSAMPHKVNPIHFENAEGNAGLAIAQFEHLSAKLPVSRLQRDLTDSTVLRNIGVPVSHMLIAIQNTAQGLENLSLNTSAIHKDLEDNWAVVAEAIQTFLRKIGYPNPYEALKELTRSGKPIGKHEMEAFVEQLSLPSDQKDFLKSITPFNYTGILP